MASYAWGDANGDKKVTIADVVFLLRVVNGVQIVPDEAADVDGNVGFTTADAVLILRYLLGEYEPNA